jgi:hypothetical protein
MHIYIYIYIISFSIFLNFRRKTEEKCFVILITLCLIHENCSIRTAEYNLFYRGEKIIKKKTHFEQTANVKKMFFKGTILLFICLVFVSTISITVYNNAQFEPTYTSSVLSSLSSVATLNACQCYCYDDSLCITGTFLGIDQSCVLFGAQLIQGQLKIMINSLASVFSFPNRTNTTGK